METLARKMVIPEPRLVPLRRSAIAPPAENLPDDLPADDEKLERNLDVEIRQSRLIQLAESCLEEAVRPSVSGMQAAGDDPRPAGHAQVGIHSGRGKRDGLL
jgi:hypothetical protein